MSACNGNCRQGRDCDCFDGAPETPVVEMIVLALMLGVICGAWVYKHFGWIGG